MHPPERLKAVAAPATSNSRVPWEYFRLPSVDIPARVACGRVHLQTGQVGERDQHEVRVISAMAERQSRIVGIEVTSVMSCSCPLVRDLARIDRRAFRIHDPR